MKKGLGFTLIELMIVMAIIAILATAGLSSYGWYVKKAMDVKITAFAAELNSKTLDFIGDHNGRIPVLDSTVTPNDINEFNNNYLALRTSNSSTVLGILSNIFGVSKGFALTQRTSPGQLNLNYPAEGRSDCDGIDSSGNIIHNQKCVVAYLKGQKFFAWVVGRRSYDIKKESAPYKALVLADGTRVSGMVVGTFPIGSSTSPDFTGAINDYNTANPTKTIDTNTIIQIQLTSVASSIIPSTTVPTTIPQTTGPGTTTSPSTTIAPKTTISSTTTSPSTTIAPKTTISSTTTSPMTTIPPTTTSRGLGQSCSQKSNCSAGLFCGIDASSNRVCTQGRTGIDKCDTHSLSVSQQCSSGYCDDYRTICSDGASGCYISGSSGWYMLGDQCSPGYGYCADGTFLCSHGNVGDSCNETIGDVTKQCQTGLCISGHCASVQTTTVPPA